MLLNMTNMSSATFSVAQAKATTQPLLWFIIGIVLYALFVFKFYRFLARKNIFQLDLHQYSSSLEGIIQKGVKTVLYVVEFLIIFPLFIFFWFAVIALILVLLSENPLGQILIIAIALVASIRITSYYDEDLSKDLAKMFPFALLGVFLVDLSSFSFAESVEVLKQIPSQWETLLYYLLFLVALELTLRMVTGLWHWLTGKKSTTNLPPQI